MDFIRSGGLEGKGEGRNYQNTLFMYNILKKLI